jgi:hypothetical protein
MYIIVQLNQKRLRYFHSILNRIMALSWLEDDQGVPRFGLFKRSRGQHATSKKDNGAVRDHHDV